MKRIWLLPWFLLAPAVASAESHVVLLDSYGTPAHFEVRGRVLEEERVPPPRKDSGALHNLKDNLEVLDADGVEDAHVTVTVGNLSRDVVTDHDGSFSAAFDDAPAPPAPGVAVAHATVTAPKDEASEADGPVFLLPDAPLIILISDVDDTVVQTNVRSKARLKLVDTVLFKNAAQLEPVPGTPLAYRSAVASGVAAILYVSGSPQGFHDRIRDYLKVQGFPAGPILLKDFSRESPMHQEGYKRTRLDALAARFPNARFVLVGDSGEKDPEIYRAFSAAYPGRVVGIVIRQTPAAPAGRQRLEGCRVFQDHEKEPDLLAGLVRHALAPAPLKPVK